MGKEDKLNVKVSSATDSSSEDIEAGITAFVSPTTGKPIDLSRNGDEAVDFILSHEDAPPALDAKADRRLLFKIDCYILPMICLLYAVQFMDKQTSSNGAIMGMRQDLDMVGDQYSWVGSAFYLGYLAFELPFAYTLQKFPVVSTVSVYIIIWGAILCLHAAPQYGGLIALRTLLGAFESAVTPAFVIITSQWYRKEEVFFRTALWFSCNGVGIMLGSGAVARSLYLNKDIYSIEAWKLNFIITGCITIVLGILIFFHLPNKPTDAWFLTDHEKRLVVERIRVNQQGFGNKQFKGYQFREALMDPKTWIYFFIGILVHIPNGGLTVFGNIIMTEELGYGVVRTLELSVSFGAVEFVGCSGFAYLYRFFPYRLFWASIANAVSVIALCLVAFADSNKHAQLAGIAMYYLVPVVAICCLASCASNVAGHTKKVTVNALFLIGYCVGNLIGPQTFVDKEAPVYNSAKIVMVVCAAVTSVLLIVLWALMGLENRRRDKNQQSSADFEKIENHEFADLTDMENPLFRYTL